MTALAAAIRAALAEVANPERAPGMQAYMKSEMPYHGVASADVKRIGKEIFADVKLESSAAWQNEVRAIFHGAKFREDISI